jgi:hypothetical protein
MRGSWGRAGVVVAAVGVAVAMAYAFEHQIAGSNGPSYWQWPFRRLPGWQLAAAMGPALAIGIAARAMHARPSWRPSAPWVLALAFLWLELGIAGAGDVEYDLRRIERIVLSHNATSYWTAAVDLVRDWDAPWLSEWPQRMAEWPLHARNKPPGPVLFYVAMHSLASDRGAFLGGLAIELLAALVVPASYALSRTLGGSPRAALETASLAALSPALSLVAPEFDQLYPLLTIAAAGTWVHALQRGSIPAAALTGLAMFVATFAAFHLAALGLPLAVLAVISARRDGHPRRIAALAAIALATFLAAHALVRAVWSYDALAVLRQALDDMRTMSAYGERVGSESRLFDLTDFALGLGWPTFVAAIAAVFLVRSPASANARALAIAGIALLLALAGGRLLPSETARTWMFVGPLLLPLAGAHLASSSALQRRAILVAALVFLGFTARNLVFIAV